MKSGLRCIIKIQTPPELDPRTGTMTPARIFSLDTAEQKDPSPDVLSVSYRKSLHEPCGSGTISMRPGIVENGKNWADLIPGYSLVSLYLQRYPENPEPVLVSLGLTGRRLEGKVYSQQQVNRNIQVTFRDVSCILVDQRTFYMPIPPQAVAQEWAPAVGARELGQPALPLLYSTEEAFAREDRTSIIDPDLAQLGESPVDAIAKLIAYVTGGTTVIPYRPDLPLINLALPDAELGDLLYFDAEKARWQLFDPGAQLVASNQLAADNEPLWNVISGWSDPTYQELFSETRDGQDTPSGRPAVEIVFRKRPFGGYLERDWSGLGGGKLAGVRDAVGSQFDTTFENDPRENIIIDGKEVLSVSYTRDVGTIQNVFLVEPVTLAQHEAPAFRTIHGPLLDGDENSPSNYRRFGLRLRNAQDRYLSHHNMPADNQIDPMSTIAREREKLLWAWHRFEPLFRKGTITVRGNPTYRVGKRLMYSHKVLREFYITGVTHSMAFGQQAPTFFTTLQVERGWDLPG